MATTVGSQGQDAVKDKFSPRSSFMEMVEYDKNSRTLDITFKSGSVHRYLFVFPTTFQVFKESPTHDAYYTRLIRGKMPSVKVRSRNVGKEESVPLKANRKRRNLDDGVQRQPGTVARAGL